jgi:hypothetical protein
MQAKLLIPIVDLVYRKENYRASQLLKPFFSPADRHEAAWEAALL